MNPSDPAAFGLPHREPFVFVDRVEEVRPGLSARCSKIFPPDTPFFRGHFPGDPLVPGVILSEALAQTAGIAAGVPDQLRSFRLSAIRQMKFLQAVRPGEQIELHATKLAEVGGLLQFQVAAHVGAQVVAEGVIVLSEIPLAA